MDLFFTIFKGFFLQVFFYFFFLLASHIMYISEKKDINWDNDTIDVKCLRNLNARIHTMILWNKQNLCISY